MRIVLDGALAAVGSPPPALVFEVIHLEAWAHAQALFFGAALNLQPNLPLTH